MLKSIVIRPIQMNLLIVVPAFNEEKRLAKTLSTIPEKFSKVSKYQILVIDDGSTDKTAEVAKKNKAKVISHGNNKGVGAAIQTAISYAIRNRFDILVNMDADGQFDGKEIPKILKPIINNEADMVAGNRFSNGKPKNMTILKYFGNKIMNKIISFVTSTNFVDVSSGFRAYNKEALLNLNLKGQFTYTQESFIDLVFKKLRIVQVPIKVKYFKDRKSKIANNLFKYAINTMLIILLTFRDYQPLKFFGIIGITSFIAGLGFDAFIFIHYLNNGSFSPYIFLALTGVYLNSFGIFILIIGIVSDMIDRMRKNQEKILYYQKLHYYEKNH